MRTVFFDIDTQNDFVCPAGALYVPGAKQILPRFAALNRHAPALISTVDAHSEDDPEFRIYPHHCVAGTLGQRKPAVTLTGAPKQHFLEKQVLDVFESPKLLPLLEQLQPERCVVYGVVTEICVRRAALGLLRLGKRVELVTDAIAALSDAAAEETLRELRQAGAHLTTTAAVLS